MQEGLGLQESHTGMEEGLPGWLSSRELEQTEKQPPKSLGPGAQAMGQQRVSEQTDSDDPLVTIT